MINNACKKVGLDYGDEVEIYHEVFNLLLGKGIVISYNEVRSDPSYQGISVDEESYVYIRAGDGEDICGYYPWRRYIVVNKANNINKEQKLFTNYVCKKCGSSAYLGLNNVDCPKCGVY